VLSKSFRERKAAQFKQLTGHAERRQSAKKWGLAKSEAASKILPLPAPDRGCGLRLTRRLNFVDDVKRSAP